MNTDQPVIRNSPYLKELAGLYRMDTPEVKQLGGESFLYLKGAQIDRQAISVPADFLCIDEIDNSSPMSSRSTNLA